MKFYMSIHLDTHTLLFHGSKATFKTFDPSYFNTGEGCYSEYQGWFFVESLKGARRHVESYLRHLEGPGYVYVCMIPCEVVEHDCEQGAEWLTTQNKRTWTP